MHESLDESPNLTNIHIFRGGNAYLWRDFNVIFFETFSRFIEFF
jgi:hypothetical protein